MSEVAVLPTKRTALERAAGFMEHHLAEIRQQAVSSDKHDYREAERLVMDATETAFAAGMLRMMAEAELSGPRTRHVR